MCARVCVCERERERERDRERERVLNSIIQYSLHTMFQNKKENEIKELLRTLL